MATKASSSWAPAIGFLEESLILPTQNARLFVSTFQLLFAHTFLFTGVAVLAAHPLAAAVLADIQTLKTTDSSATRQHAKKLAAIYLAYLASKLATQLVAVLAASETYSGERRSLAELLRRRVLARVAAARGPLLTTAFAAVLELSSTAALLAALLAASWSWQSLADIAGKAKAAAACGYLLCLAVLLLLNVCLAAVLPASIAVSAADGACRGPRALRAAWRLARARGRAVSAALVLAAGVLPAVVYPVPAYAFSFMNSPEAAEDAAFAYYEPDAASGAVYATRMEVNHAVWLLGAGFGFVLPSAGAQLFAAVAATVFCRQSMDTDEGRQACTA
ncbi:hypothetical protein ACP4OV_005883 [Aristida adscensionis]